MSAQGCRAVLSKVFFFPCLASQRSQELESQICSQQREKRDAMEDLRAQLQAEKAEGLRKLQEELEQVGIPCRSQELDIRRLLYPQRWLGFWNRFPADNKAPL